MAASDESFSLRRNRFAILFLSMLICLRIPTGDSADSAVVGEFVETSVIGAHGEEVSIPFMLSRPLAGSIPVAVFASCCFSDAVTGPLQTPSWLINADVTSSAFTFTPMLATSVRPEVIDCYVRSIVPGLATNEEVVVGPNFAVQITVTGGRVEPYFPSDLYPLETIETFEILSFEFYVFLSQPMASTTTINLRISSTDGASFSDFMCNVQPERLYEACETDIRADTFGSVGDLEFDIAIQTDATYDLPKAHLRTAHYNRIDDTMDSTDLLYFERGLRMVDEDAGVIEIKIKTPTAIDMDGTIELEVIPENLASYIVQPLTLVVAPGNVVATSTVTIIDDAVDEGFYESFRIRIKCSTGITNQPSTKATQEGMRFVIFDNDIATTEVLERDVCVPEANECYALPMQFNPPYGTNQRGDYRVCDSSGNIVTDSRDIVYASTYEVPADSCDGNLCTCVFDGLVPEPEDIFYISPLPPSIKYGEIAGQPSQLVRFTITDNDVETTDSETITALTTDGASASENMNGYTVTVTASGPISGVVTVGVISGTATEDADFVFTTASYNFDNEMSHALYMFNVLADEEYEHEEYFDIWIIQSPVRVDVDPVRVTISDTNVAFGVYPEALVAYENCPVHVIVFKKVTDTFTQVLTEAVISGNSADLTFTWDPADKMLTDSAVLTLTITPTRDLPVQTDQFYEIEISADLSGSITKQVIQLTVKHYDSSPPEYHAAQDFLACIQSTADTCDLPICSLASGEQAAQTISVNEITAEAGVHYTDFSAQVFTISAVAGSDPELVTPTELNVVVSDVADPTMARELVVTLDNIGEDITVQLYQQNTVYDDSGDLDVADIGVRYFVLEGQSFFIPGLEEYQDALLAENFSPEMIIDARSGTAELGIDFTLEVEPKSNYVYVNILQDSMLEELEEFVVFMKCDVAIPTAVRYSATICIIDDEKEEAKEVLSTTELASTTFLPSTTDSESTTYESTTHDQSTTRGQSTTRLESTTWAQSTTVPQSSTMFESTTWAQSTTVAQSSTFESSTFGESTTFGQSTTVPQSSTFESSTFFSTTFFSSTLDTTTGVPVTTPDVPTTRDIEPTTGDVEPTTRDVEPTTRDVEPTTPEVDDVITTVVVVTTPPDVIMSTTPSDNNCVENTDVCDADATCIPIDETIGFCSCNEGFEGNGFYCRPEPLCDASQFQCSDNVCIPANRSCDGFVDCANDETSCAGSCQVPTPPENGVQVDAENGRVLYPSGSTVTFACNSGAEFSYTLVGQATVTCINGNFQATPVCFEDCTDPMATNASPAVITTFYDHDSTLTINCDSGFTGQSTTVTCNNGQWQGGFPSCVSCDTANLDCDVNAECKTDSEGFPFCTCLEGFLGNGEFCEDQDECADNLDNCVAPRVCMNTPGSFTCGASALVARSLGGGDSSINAASYLPFVSSFIPLPEPFYVSILSKKFLYFTENGVVSFSESDSEVPDPASFVNPDDLGLLDPSLAVLWGSLLSGTVEHRVYDNPGDTEQKETLTRIGSFVREWDDTQFASSIAFVPTWAVVIFWENVHHLDYPSFENTFQCIITSDGTHTFSLLTYQYVVWPTAEKLVLGLNTGSQSTEINPEDYEGGLGTKDGIEVYKLHEIIGNSGLPGKWLFRLDSYDGSNSDAKQKCLDYYHENRDSELSLEYVKRCPDCMLSVRSLQFYPCSYQTTGTADFGYFNQDGCLSQKVLSSYPSDSPGSICQYDSDGILMPLVSYYDVWSSSVVQKIHPRSRNFVGDRQTLWLNQDVDFRYQCCIRSGSDDYCDLYHSVRPSPSEARAEEYAASGGFGAGNYITCDGLQYSFSAIGEFTVMRIEEAGLEIQVRTEGRGQGSVTTGIAILLDAALLEIFAEGEAYKVVSSGSEIELSDLTEGTYITEQVLVSWGPDTWNLSRNALDIVLLPALSSNATSEIYLRVLAVAGSLSYVISVDEVIISRSNTEGLLGVCNSDIFDDFQYPDGRIYPHQQLGESVIFQYGQSWRTTPDTSLFRFEPGYSWSSHNDEDFTPLFFGVDSLDELQPHERELCEDITECLHDLYLIGDVTIARASKQMVPLYGRSQDDTPASPKDLPKLVEMHPDSENPGINEDGILTVEVGQSYSFRYEDYYIRGVNAVPGAAVNESDGSFSWTPVSPPPRELILSISDDDGIPFYTRVPVSFCDCGDEGECFYERVWEEDNGRTDSVARVYCTCPDGFISKSCSADVDRCEQNPCYPGVTCIDPGRPQPVHCGSCPPNLVGDGFDCDDYDECTDPGSCDQICVNEPGSFSCQCRPGYELQPDGRTCQDIDECGREESLCQDSSVCVNTVGGYQCSCLEGYRSVGTFTCIDINECYGSSSCSDNEVCVNEAGSFHCDCSPGFIRQNGICVDLDECLSPLLHDCHADATCINTIGSYDCKCNHGFEGNGEFCRDMDECRISPIYCHPRFDCTNTRGGFICSCPEGFLGNGDECFDIDECLHGNITCGDHMTCHNRIGSYTCECEDGYQLDFTGLCQNVNECQQQIPVCPANSYCIDLDGSYHCQCVESYFKQDGQCLSIETECSSSPSCIDPSCASGTCSCDDGYALDDSSQKCIDVDECFTEIHGCDVNADCVNTAGGYTCTCKEGYVGSGTQCEDRLECGNGDGCSQTALCAELPGTYECSCQDGYEGNGRNCVDTKECQFEGTCSANFICEEQVPGFNCGCPAGFLLVDDDCLDIDECDRQPCIEGAACINTEGSFYCQCPSGYYGDGQPGHSGCQDVNECQTGDARCPANSECENDIGTYSCYCEEGYKLEEGLCVDVDECSDVLHDCDANATCINLPGTFTCRCNHGFFDVPIDGEDGYAKYEMCQDIDECQAGSHDCSGDAVCHNEAGSYTCTCKDGFHGDGRDCQDVNECLMSRPCYQQTQGLCLNRVGGYRCICGAGYYEDGTGSCSASNSIELRVEFSDIKGLRTVTYYNLIDEEMLDRLADDVAVLFSHSEVYEYILGVLVTDMFASQAGLALITIRVDFDLRANMTNQTAQTMFGGLLEGRHSNVIPPDNIVSKYEVFYAEDHPCLTGDHQCFEQSHSHCQPTVDGGYECSGCQTGYRSDNNGNCIPDPCVDGERDCVTRFFSTCLSLDNDQFACQDCIEGYIQQGESCLPDPCIAGQQTCKRLNFVYCVPDGNNQYHCRTCRPGYQLVNGGCISAAGDNPCESGANTCVQNHFQTCVLRDNPCESGANSCVQNNFQTCVYDGEGAYHCEDCLPGYHHEGSECISDPCQLHQDNCRQRNFERCVYSPGGRYSCDTCMAGYTLEGTECIADGASNMKRYRGKLRILSVNNSESLAEFRPELSRVNSDTFQLYEEQVCTILFGVLSSQSHLFSGGLSNCFTFSFRNGSIISYVALDVSQTSRSMDLSADIKQSLLNGGTSHRNGLLLTSGRRQILIDVSSLDVIDTSKYGCNRNSICTNGGTCIEDSSVYDYQCRCPPDYEGLFCQLVAQRPTNDKPTLTPPSLPSESDRLPAWSLILLTIGCLLSAVLLACCCCLLYATGQQGKAPRGIYNYTAPVHGKRPIHRGPIRNPLVSLSSSHRHHVPYVDAPWDVENESGDFTDWSERHDRKRMRMFADIINNAQPLNQRMRDHADGVKVVRNRHAVPKAQGFQRPIVVDGTEASSLGDEKAPPAYREEYHELSERSSYKPILSSSSSSSSGTDTTSESSV